MSTPSHKYCLLDIPSKATTVKATFLRNEPVLVGCPIPVEAHGLIRSPACPQQASEFKVHYSTTGDRSVLIRYLDSRNHFYDSIPGGLFKVEDMLARRHMAGSRVLDTAQKTWQTQIFAVIAEVKMLLEEKASMDKALVHGMEDLEAELRR